MTHIRPIDYLAHVLEGAPLPCACADCREQADLWARERGACRAAADALPPGFLARQEQALDARLAQRPRPALRWAFAAGAAGLVVTAGLMYTLRPSREARWTEVQARYETALAGLDQPALGNLEACALVLTEPTDTTDTTTSEEESL
jgi:hypothetical protein